MKGSPGGPQGKAKKMKQAGPPETKKQRKQRLQAERNAAHQRAASAKKARTQQQAQQDANGPAPTPEELHRRNMRAGRFGSGAVDQSAPVRVHAPVYAAALSRERHMEGADCDGKWDQQAVQGTCSNLEKKYFRLTGPPDPSAVRPPHILRAALDRMVRIYRAGQCDMHYAEDQLKAMRQDVTVQHVRGALPVHIYEAHARACLEHGNGGDFNQCQAQLTVLYEEGSPGCLHEFVAYRVLYQSILRSKESASLLATLEQLSPQVCAHPAVAHALKVRQALVFSRFTAFFHLYASAPNLGRALMDMCFSRVRFAALETVVDAFKNTKVKVLYVATVLGFLVKLQAQGDGQEQQSTQAMHDLEVHSQEAEQNGALRLPGCAKPTYMGKHPAEVDGERAAQAAVQWLRSCNANVVLEQGGVYGACCIYFDGICSCDSLDYKRVFVSKHCAFPCCCSKLCCSSLLHGPESESVRVASLGLTVLFVQVHSPQLHCWTANHPYAFPCLKMSLLLHMGMPLSTCTASCIKCMSINSAASSSTAISHHHLLRLTYDSNSCGTTQVCSFHHQSVAAKG